MGTFVQAAVQFAVKAAVETTVRATAFFSVKTAVRPTLKVPVQTTYCGYVGALDCTRVTAWFPLPCEQLAPVHDVLQLTVVGCS